ncbi:MAG: hypothetical protein B7Y35_05975 [Sphingomonadales bacterium 28-64-96]|nr:MAG: hypothetical protein B7Y35_05975 [Sphingomonadales bacterium 28-64-96]
MIIDHRHYASALPDAVAQRMAEARARTPQMVNVLLAAAAKAAAAAHRADPATGNGRRRLDRAREAAALLLLALDRMDDAGRERAAAAGSDTKDERNAA